MTGLLLATPAFAQGVGGGSTGSGAQMATEATETPENAASTSGDAEGGERRICRRVETGTGSRMSYRADLHDRRPVAQLQPQLTELGRRGTAGSARRGSGPPRCPPKPAFSATRIEADIVGVDDRDDFRRRQHLVGPGETRPRPPRWHSPARARAGRRSSPFREAPRSLGSMSRLKSAKPTWPIRTPSSRALDRPIAVAEQRPQAGRAQQLAPGVLARERRAAEIAHDLGVAHHRRLGVEIACRERAEDEPRGLAASEPRLGRLTSCRG